MSSASWIRDLLAWRAERLPVRLWLPLAATLWLASGSLTTIGGILALGLVAFLRLWDDLADREDDAVREPERVLPRSDPRPFRVAAAVIGFACAGLVASGPSPVPRLLAFVALAGALAAWYAGLRRRVGPVPGYHVLLAKYPAAILVLGAERSVTTAAAAVYLGLLVYEVAHDARLRSLGRARAAALVEAPLLIGVLLGRIAS